MGPKRPPSASGSGHERFEPIHRLGKIFETMPFAGLYGVVFTRVLSPEIICLAYLRTCGCVQPLSPIGNDGGNLF